MKSSLLKLPVGVDSFEKIRKDGFYYVDKTTLIEQLLEQWGEVNLFTRPRRFGKTLNMSMLRCFFEIGADRSLFDGLDISKNQKLCNTYMGRFPVVFLSLKNVDGLTFADAKYRLTELVAAEAERFLFLSDSKKLSENEKNRYQALIALDHGRYTMDETILVSSLQLLSQLLYRHYGQKTIILIDEYDVPLDKAFQHGYYKEMVSLIRGLFGQALKTNDALQFAVLTGCLRVSKESIFTGLNNFKVLSITDARFDEQFGFTEQEVSELLETYHLEEHQAETKEWYDGYHIGGADVYCPWDVINHVDRLRGEPGAQLQTVVYLHFPGAVCLLPGLYVSAGHTMEVCDGGVCQSGSLCAAGAEAGNGRPFPLHRVLCCDPVPGAVPGRHCPVPEGGTLLLPGTVLRAGGCFH